ncbi:MAG: hypothetical protein ABH840_00600 [Nanoarchaeota archaeon]
MPENPAIIGHELREEKQECLDFYNHWLGKDYVKCQGCSSYVQRGKGFPETSNNPTNCSEACRDLSFGRAMVKPTRYFQGEKLFELKDGQLVEIVEKPED